MNEITITTENVTAPERLARLDLNKVAALHEGGTDTELRELAEYLGVPADTLIARAEYFRSVKSESAYYGGFYTMGRVIMNHDYFGIDPDEELYSYEVLQSNLEEYIKPFEVRGRFRGIPNAVLTADKGIDPVGLMALNEAKWSYPGCNDADRAMFALEPKPELGYVSLVEYARLSGKHYRAFKSHVYRLERLNEKRERGSVKKS
ncbi:hypothetical protein MBO12_01220 [Candidatus Saccharibacteria bacterium]|nr:hypothetical protein [Candidatus Saccharibacteria bacterium]